MTPCPSPLELSRWKVGNVSSPRFEEITDHVESCDSCMEGLENPKGAQGTDPLLDQLEQIGSVVELEAVPRSLVDKISQLQNIPADSDLPFEAVTPFTKAGGRELDGGWGYAGVYQLLAPLACGGMGLVFRGRHEKLDRLVAIKFLKTEFFPIKTMRERFLKEARVMASLDHPNLVPILDASEVAGLPFLVMPFLVGETLAERLAKESPLPVETVLHLGLEICKALEYLHARGLVHRDIKPSNLWVDSEWRSIRLGDLGIVLDMNLVDRKITLPGTIMGTPGFQAPEIIAGQSGSAVSDLFSLGATLFETLTGRSPFCRTDWAGVIEELALKKLPRASLYCPGIPKEIDDLLARMLERDPNRRPASAVEVMTILAACGNPKTLRTGKWNSTRRGWMLGTGVIALGATVTLPFFWPSPLARKDDPSQESSIARPYGKLAPPKGGISSLVFSPDGKILFSSDQFGNVTTWNWRDLVGLSSFPLWSGSLQLNISPNGESLACLSTKKRAVHIFRTANPTKEMANKIGFVAFVPMVTAFPSSGSWVAVGSSNDSDTPVSSNLSITNLELGMRNIETLGDGRINAMVCHPMQDVLYLSFGNRLEAGMVKGQKREVIWGLKSAGEVKSLLVSPDGQFLFVAASALCQYTTEGKLLGTFQGDLTTSLAMVLLNDGKTLAVLEEKALSLWDIPSRRKRTHQELPAMDSLGPVAFHPNGQVIAYASGNAIQIELIL